MAKKRNLASGGAAPLPISALPLPVDDEPAAEPEPSLPVNSSGELTPAQRARLGLDIYGDQPAAPVNGNGNGHANGNGNGNGAPSEFDFAEINPFEQEPATPEPRLAAVDNTPKLAPVGAATVRVRRDEGAAEEPSKAARKAEKQRNNPAGEDGTPDLDRDRNVFTYGVSWTIFCVVVTAAIGLGSGFSDETGQAPGPGPFIPGVVSILLGWAVVFAARGMKKNWAWLMLVPAAVLFIGPFFYSMYWATSTEDTARAYLSPAGQNSLVDVDQTSIISETINTPKGCFAITRDRKSFDTEVAVVTKVPSTARQQADYALAPRYARRVNPGGAKLTGRVFTFKRGQNPAIVTDAVTAPLDCAN